MIPQVPKPPSLELVGKNLLMRNLVTVERKARANSGPSPASTHLHTEVLRISHLSVIILAVTVLLGSLQSTLQLDDLALQRSHLLLEIVLDVLCLLLELVLALDGSLLDLSVAAA